jgi:hypothetical protein
MQQPLSPERASSCCTSASVVCAKFRYHRPTARKGSGVITQIASVHEEVRKIAVADLWQE